MATNFSISSIRNNVRIFFRKRGEKREQIKTRIRKFLGIRRSWR